MDPSSRDPARRDSLRHVRRVSNWTAAVLIAGTGTAAVAQAHQAAPTTAASAPAARRVTHSVATTTASGVTVTTTTRTVNGKTVVTRVRHTPAGGDN